ncbi:hypothetical protein Saso_69730 [Streptomyces asoensis]|uniref:Uncharacterized protein n=1 Tax=Streptomyces asoensis TaxID=249586 RepID=A0ABQ3SB25_9ACTN|nr:hypothetical protein GCM10010496_18640 [Streptomyces asoensis]GHI65323.1 hypothetical protein Saso_69730 [Streptomyces asoensis]
MVDAGDIGRLSGQGFYKHRNRTGPMGLTPASEFGIGSLTDGNLRPLHAVRGCNTGHHTAEHETHA